MSLYQSAIWTPSEEGVRWDVGSLTDANLLLAQHHYLGPSRPFDVRHIFIGWKDGEPVACQVWRKPTSRRLPRRLWLELSRWCLTPAAGKNSGSRMMGWVVRWFRKNTWNTTLISYSDPSAGHTGALYKASGWIWKPTWHRIVPPPSGLGSWDGVKRQEVKDRWAYFLNPDTAQALLDLEPAYQRAMAASSDAPRFQRGEGGSQPTPSLQDRPWVPTTTVSKENAYSPNSDVDSELVA